MKKIFSTLLVLVMLFSILPFGAAFAGDPVTYDLMAGQNIDVGDVTVSDDGDYLTVAYNIDVEGWFIVQAHLYADVKKPKNGAPGRFPYNSGPVHDTSFEFNVPLADLGVESGEELFISAHAVVNNENNIVAYMDNEGNEHEEPGFDIVGYEDNDGVRHTEPGFDIVGYRDSAGNKHEEPGVDIVGYDCPTLEEIATALPEYTTMQIFGDGAGYYDVKIDLNGDGVFGADETFDWYCIDQTHSIGLGVYTVRVYSSYETLPDEIINNGTGDNNVDHPENLDLVNWVINNPGSLNQSQVQDVIWALVDDAKSRENLDAAEQAVYDEALNHDGFVPDDGQNLAIVLQPVDASNNSVGQVTIGQVTIGQVSFGTLGLECTPIEQPWEPIEEPWDPIEEPWKPVFQSETGWASPTGDGVVNFKQGWGSYFTYLIEPAAE